jgi:hypothetical protein
VIVKARKAKEKQAALEKSACEAQSASPLLTLPRELRDKIWDLVTVGNVIHVSQITKDHPKRRGRNSRIKKYSLHMCTSPQGYNSVACPPGTGDHALCVTSGQSNYGDWRAACKQMCMEIPRTWNREGALARNALQFADLETAQSFVFGLQEEDRASISHLRLAVPYSITHSHPQLSAAPDLIPWYSICNYFSNPWDRKSVCHPPCMSYSSFQD